MKKKAIVSGSKSTFVLIILVDSVAIQENGVQISSQSE
jgi:hypothetical protein